jgi:dihydrofolate reductase
MRKLIASINITLDGFMAGPDGSLDWHFAYWDCQMCESLGQLLSEADTLLLGANTYVAFAGYWPSKTSDLCMARQDIILAEIMNNYKKVVISKTINGNAWHNTTVLKGKLQENIYQLKKQPGRDIVVLGSRSLLIALMKHKLIDQFELWVHPVKIENGRELFKPSSHNFSLCLVDSRPFNSGVVRMTYKCEQP